MRERASSPASRSFSCASRTASSARRTTASELLGVERLLEVVVGARLHRLDRLPLRAVGGDRRRPAAPASARASRRSSSIPSMPGMRRSVTTSGAGARLEARERLGAVRRLVHREPLRLEDLAQRVADARRRRRRRGRGSRGGAHAARLPPVGAAGQGELRHGAAARRAARASRSPPCCRASARAMVRPSPEPSGFVVDAGREDAPRERRIERRGRGRAPGRARRRPRRLRLELHRGARAALASSAFCTRLMSTCFTLRGSQRTGHRAGADRELDAALARHPLVQRGHLAAERAHVRVAERERHERAREVQELVEDRLHPVDLAPEHRRAAPRPCPRGGAGARSPASPFTLASGFLSSWAISAGERGQLLGALGVRRERLLLRRERRAGPSGRTTSAPRGRRRLANTNTSESIAACV